MSLGVIVIGDSHIGPRKNVPVTDEKILAQLAIAFSKVTVYAGAKSLDVAIAGDLFDAPVISPSFVKIVLDARNRLESGGGRLFAIAGNHDVRRGQSNALDYLSPSRGSIFHSFSGVVSAGGMRILFVPYSPLWSAEETITNALSDNNSEVKKKIDVIIAHVGVYKDMSSPAWTKEDPSYVDSRWLFQQMEDNGIKVAVVGHDHTHQQFMHTSNGYVRRIVQVGAFFPRAFSETGFNYGNAVVLRRNTSSPAKDYIEVEVKRNFAPGIRFFDVFSDGMEEYLAPGSLVVARDNRTSDQAVVETSFVDTVVENETSTVGAGVTTQAGAVSAYVRNHRAKLLGIHAEALARMAGGTLIGVPVRVRRWTDRF